MRREFYYDSQGAGRIRAMEWTPDNAPTAVVQIVHGITEHVERYDQFARYLNKKGYLVVAHDHMGHGKSVEDGGIPGYFHGGWDAVLADILALHRETKTAHPDLPYILLGHSMGSFLVRTILCRYPELEISGVILSGTGWLPDWSVRTGFHAAKTLCAIRGEKTPGRTLTNLMFSSFNARVERKRTAFDWLTRDTVIVDAYVNDPMCGFAVSYGLIRDMAGGVLEIQKPEALMGMNKQLPVLLLSGGDDPVGGYGRGVRQTAEAFRDAGMEEVHMKIYPLCRHEILNEINRAEVFRTVNIWIREYFH